MIIINIVSITVNVAGAVIPLSDKIKIISATLDANLTMAVSYTHLTLPTKRIV